MPRVDDGYDFEHARLRLDVSGHYQFGGNQDDLPVNFLLVETPGYIASLRLDGGHLALDFVNTLGGSHALGPQPHDEHLRGYTDLLAWSVRAGSLSEAAAGRLARAAAEQPSRAGRAFAAAIELRELAYAVLRPVAEGDVAPAPPLRRLLEEECKALGHARLEPGERSYRWRWEDGDLRLPLWPLAHATVGLLTEGPLDRLKVCGECRWLFLDRSKNRSRRWCSMEDCGTAVKMRRYTERRRTRALGTGRVVREAAAR
jgi:predicted RNA-binding Zn ribbon-like protein